MKKSIITILIFCLPATALTSTPLIKNSSTQPIRHQPQTKETRKWSWLGSLGALCENVGVNGAYRVNVEAQAEKTPSGMLTISAMALWASGALIEKDNTVTTAKFEVKKGDTILNTVVLARPDPPSIETNPQPGESWRLYLPKAKPSIEVPAGAKLFFTVTAQIKLEGGICSLGVSKEKVDPFIPTPQP